MVQREGEGKVVQDLLFREPRFEVVRMCLALDSHVGICISWWRYWPRGRHA